MRSLLLLALPALLVGVPRVARADKGDKGVVSVGGRLFSRAELEKVDGQELVAGAEVRSLRLEADWRWRFLRAVGEVELARGQTEVRDAFLRARGQPFGSERVDVLVGRTKVPFSRFTLASAWTLPTIRRGLLDGTVRDRALIGGRGTGLFIEARTRLAFAPAALVSFTQAEDATGRPIPDAGKAAGRLEATFGPVDVGVSAEARQAIARPDVGTGTWAAFEADAAFEKTLLDLTWRGWAEVSLAKTWIDLVPTDGDDAWLVAAQALLAARLEGDRQGEEYVEAFVFFQALEPDVDVVADAAWEAGGGFNVGWWRRARVQLQVERWSAARNTPSGYALVDQTVALGQVGVSF